MALVKSRLMHHDIGGERVAMMIPVADLMNHDPIKAQSISCYYDEKKKGYLI